MMRGVLGMLLGLIPLLSFAAEWDEAYVEALFADRILDPIEGVWQFPADGASVVIVKHSSSTFDIFLLDSPRLDVMPGTLIGSAVTSPKRNYYDGELRPRQLGDKTKLGKQSVTFTVNDGGTLSIRPYSDGYKLSFRRWFNYFFKISISRDNSRPKDLDGARRVYPYRLSDNFPLCL